MTTARARLILGCQLLSAALLYTVGAARSGWGNAYYAAAAQAGSLSWHAFLFGASDPAGGITVDKPPASLWLMAASARLFGLSPEAVLWPQAACAVTAVALLYLSVRRVAGPGAGLLASGLLAVTPVMTLMGRYDNPDTLMTVLLVGAGYAVTRAIGRERGGLAWVAAAGVLVGMAFLTKQIQGLLVLPALACAVLVAAPGTLRRRVGWVAAGAAGVAVGAGWWLALVQLTPASGRPFVGGTRGNSVWELTLSYNGLGRLNGSTSGGGASNGTHAANFGRLFGSGGDEAGWLLPAALALLVAGLVVTRGVCRRDPLRAGLLMWGAWLVVVGVVLSSLRGISHSYYTIELAPAIAAVVALGGAAVWERLETVVWARPLLVTVTAVSALWSCALLAQRPAWTIAAIPVVFGAAVVVVVVAVPSGGFGPGRRRLAVAAAMVALVLGPTAWSVATAQSVHQGANLESGPGLTSFGSAPGIVPGTRIPVVVADVVRAGAGGFDWSAAVVGRSAAQLQLVTGVSVRMVGGFSGGDPDPTLAAFETLVAQGRVHYLVVQASQLTLDRSTTAGQIVGWTRGRFPDQQDQGWVVFDLTSPRLQVAGDGGVLRP